jgi:hypothetical protein
MVTFFFVKDYRHKYRFFSSEPAKLASVKRSKAKEAWELAKKKLMLLPQRILRQEQAFGRALKLGDPALQIIYSGIRDEKKINHKFYFFLYRQRTKRIFILIGEALLVPITGLLTPIPGPNIAFYALALLIITHWLSFRGIRRILKKGHEFVESPLLAEWEQAVSSKKEDLFPDILARIENEYHLENIQKVLWK